MGKRHRDELGARVREVWIKWASTQAIPKPSWFIEYDKLSEPDKEADRLIGEVLFSDGALMSHGQFAKPAPTPTPREAIERALHRQEEVTAALWDFAHELQTMPANAERGSDGAKVNLTAMGNAQATILKVFGQETISIQ